MIDPHDPLSRTGFSMRRLSNSTFGPVDAAVAAKPQHDPEGSPEWRMLASWASIHHGRRLMKCLTAAALALSLAGPSAAQTDREARYLEETGRAMEKMMTDMNPAPTGDVDVDFVAMMVPHHRGAIDMARAELVNGSNEVLRRIAQGIIVAQLQEIEAMNRAVQSNPAALAGTLHPAICGISAPKERRHAL